MKEKLTQLLQEGKDSIAAVRSEAELQEVKALLLGKQGSLTGLLKELPKLAAALRPELPIVDSLCGDLDFEEGGNPVPTGRMLLGEDPVQLDA